MCNNLNRYVIFSMPFLENTLKYNPKNQERTEIFKAIKKACDQYYDICLNNIKLIECLYWKTLDIHDDNPKIYISNHGYKEKIRLLICYNLNVGNNESNKIIGSDKSVRFIVKCEIDQNVEKVSWSDSPEGYSVLVKTNIDNLEQIILDVFVDISVLYKVLYKVGLISLIGNKYRLNALCMKKTYSARKKIAESMGIKDENFIDYPSSFYFKNNNIYDFEKIYQFWISVMFYKTMGMEAVPKVFNIDDLISMIQSRKRKGSINKKQLIDKFEQKCNESGYYFYVRLEKSIIGIPEKRKRRIKTILGEDKCTINHCNFISLKDIQMIDQMKDLLYSFVFEYVKSVE